MEIAKSYTKMGIAPHKEESATSYKNLIKIISNDSSRFAV